jgi:hypothetical protein
MCLMHTGSTHPGCQALDPILPTIPLSGESTEVASLNW